MSKIFIYARPCVNKDFFFMNDVFSCVSCFFSEVLSVQTSTAIVKNVLDFFGI